jgi:regulator of sirC expression with transglutaminase-like and TPR domain
MFFSSFIPIGKGIELSLLFCLLYSSSALEIELLCVIFKDFLLLSLIISTPRNSLISPRLVTSSLEAVVKS